jgi:hypothetical protein
MKIVPLLLLALAAAAQAQAPSADSVPPAVGHLTGRVSCHDTGQPGRFASIQLLSAQAATLPPLNPPADITDADRSKSIAAITSALKSALKGVFNGSNLSTLSGLDGKFQLDKIPPGTYYVIAQLPGYTSPLSTLSQQQRLAPQADTFAAIAGQAQKLIVLPGQTLNVNIDLHRGATLSGIVSYSDGSPAPNVAPQLLLQAKDGTWKQIPANAPLPAVTDDHGGFRIFGLPPGRYAVKAALPTDQAIIGVGFGQMSTHMAPGDALVVYSGGALRESELKPIELAGEDNRKDVNLTFPLAGLHTIAGTVVAESDGHAVNAGSIELQDPATKASLRTVPVGHDGSFILHYVRDGAYVVKVSRAADMQAGSEDLPCPVGCKEIRSYASTAMPVTVNADLSAVRLQVTAHAP